MRVPLFPLNTVLFPGGPLPLRIFEARYLDMVSECLRQETPFGVLLIRVGDETDTASTYEVGTLARIVDWYQGSDGLLGVTAVGEQRFRVLSATRQPDGLSIGDVELLEDEAPVPLADEYRSLADILSGVLDDLGRLYESLERRYDDASWVSYRLVEILPIDLEQKQACLEECDTATRLKLVNDLINSVRDSSATTA